MCEIIFLDDKGKMPKKRKQEQDNYNFNYVKNTLQRERERERRKYNKVGTESFLGGGTTGKPLKASALFKVSAVK